MKVLGLDVSTANVGVCVIDTGCRQGGRVQLAYGIPLSKFKGLYTKASILREHLLDIASKHNIDIIIIEESLQRFRGGMSSAGVIAKLNRFNGIASYLARSVLDVPLHLANVVSTRKSIGCSINRKSELSTKEQVLAWVTAHPDMSGFEWPIKILKSGPNKGKKCTEGICYDIADAFVVALFGADVLKTEDYDDTNV